MTRWNSDHEPAVILAERVSYCENIAQEMSKRADANPALRTTYLGLARLWLDLAREIIKQELERPSPDTVIGPRL